MTDLTKSSSWYDRWINGLPFLSPPRAPDGSRARAPMRSSWLTELRCRLRTNAVDRARGVRAATPRLDRLAQRLREDRGVRAEGVARARLLLTDGDSVLYDKGDDSGLVHAVRSALALL